MFFNPDDGELTDDGLSAEDLAKIESIRDFFFDNFKSSNDPLECVYLTTSEVHLLLMKSFPKSKLTEADVDSWLSGSFVRKDVGDGSIKIVWAIYRKTW